MGHALLIAALVNLQPTGILVQRLAKTNHNAVAEDGKYTVHKFCDLSVQFHILIIQEFHNRLAHSHHAHCTSSLSQHTVSPYFSLLALINPWMASAVGISSEQECAATIIEAWAQPNSSASYMSQLLYRP